METQRDVIAFLADPKSHGGHIMSVDCVETHAARIFLAGDLAYKIKKPVVFPFLDFSTLKKRHVACRNELVVNRRAAPQLYLGLVAITRDETGSLHIDGEGEVVEWAVKMRRFPGTALYKHMAEAGALTVRHMRPLARAIKALHATAPRLLDKNWSRSRLGEIITHMVQDLTLSPALHSQERVEALISALRAGLKRLSSALDARGLSGYVRHCHGDLHLANIVEIDGAPVLFDAIEFDDAIATVDVLYDLAFLIMDLWCAELKPHANHIFNAYVSDVADTGNLSGLSVLPLFLAIRAGIRAQVYVLRWRQNPDDPGGVKAAGEAERYFAAAQDFSRVRPPSLIAIGGLSGTGKTTVARHLAAKIGAVPGAVHLRSDVIRKQLFGVAETSPLPHQAYTPTVTEHVYRAMQKMAGLSLEAGHSVIADAVHAKRTGAGWYRVSGSPVRCALQGLVVAGTSANALGPGTCAPKRRL